MTLNFEKVVLIEEEDKECYKCGKNLMSEQSLKYHLNKKLPCDSERLLCKCGMRFSTLFDVNIHLIHCKIPSKSVEEN